MSRFDSRLDDRCGLLSANDHGFRTALLFDKFAGTNRVAPFDGVVARVLMGNAPTRHRCLIFLGGTHEESNRRSPAASVS
jgi:hypothetical protein